MNSTSPPQPRFRGQALDSEQRQTFPRTISQDERELNFDTASAVDSCVGSEEGARPKSASGSPPFALELQPGSPVPPRAPSRSAVSDRQKSPPLVGAAPELSPKPANRPAGAISPPPLTSPLRLIPNEEPPAPTMAQRVDALRKHVDEVIQFCVRVQRENQLVVSEFVSLRNSLLLIVKKQEQQQSTLDGLGRIQQEHQNLIELLQRAVQTAHLEREAAHKQSTTLQRNVAAMQSHIEALKGDYAALTEHLVKSTQDRFEMLGPLPPDYTRVETLTGPFALHETTQTALRPHVTFSQSRNTDDTSNTRVHVNVTKEVLANLATWANGLCIREDVLGHGDLWSLYCYARTQGSQKLQQDAMKELHRAGLDASARFLSAYAKERRHLATPYVDKMVECIAETIRAAKPSGDAHKITVRIPLGAAPDPGLRSQPLFNDHDRVPDWRNDIAYGFVAFTEYCKKCHVSCQDNPQLLVHETSRAMTLAVHCQLPY